MATEVKAAENRAQQSGRWQALLLLSAAVAGGGLALARGESVQRPRVAVSGVPREAGGFPIPEVASPTPAVGTSGLPARGASTVSGSGEGKRPARVVSPKKTIPLAKSKPARPGQQPAVAFNEQVWRTRLIQARSAAQAAQARVKAAEASYRVAETRLARAAASEAATEGNAATRVRQAEQVLAAAQSRLTQLRERAQAEDGQAEARAATARSAMQTAREHLEALRERTQRQEAARAQAQATVAQAQTQAAKLKEYLDRQEQLLRLGAVAVKDVETARREHAAATAAVNAAKEQLALIKEAPGTEEIRAQEEAVRQAEAALQEAEAQRGRPAGGQEEVQAAEAQVRQAQGALDAARTELVRRGTAANKGRDKQTRDARAAVTQARAAVSQARAVAARAQAEVRSIQSQLEKART